MKTLKELLTCLISNSEPKVWDDSVNNIEQENIHLKKIINKSFVYGANTLPGHRDKEHTAGYRGYNLHNDIINTHTIGSEPYYSKHATKCIGYAKIFSWSAGGSGISPELYKSVIELVKGNNFYPKIPVGSSYSCGDVIPGSHWAKEVLQLVKPGNKDEIKPGETMALINGSFIQVGYAISLIEKLKSAWILYLELTALNNMAVSANNTNLFYQYDKKRVMASSAIEYIKTFSVDKLKKSEIQDPVSVRAVPQIIDTFCQGIEEYLSEIDHLLNKPSGNPLVSLDFDFTLSQASFLAPTLSIKTSSLIEAILFVMWSVIGRTNYLLSGDANNIPIDAANKDSKLGLIQYPKMMMAILEKSRMNYGRRLFSSGSQTSYGVEDLWTNGVFALDQLDDLLDDFMHFCSIEANILSYVSKKFPTVEMKDNEIIKIIQNNSNAKEVLFLIKKHITDGGLAECSRLFPV